MPNETWDAVVIGAGAASLAAAKRLGATGRRVLVLEARDRIGGRIDTRHEPGWPVPVEAGAEFVHGHSRAAWDAVEKAGLATDEVNDGHWRPPEGRPDPFARGAYSYVPAGALDAVDRLAEPVAETLFFAGEATDTVAGASASGERAADAALARADEVATGPTA